MERIIFDTLTIRLTESIEFNRRFGVVKSEAAAKIVSAISVEIRKDRHLQPSLDRDFLEVFDELIVAFCMSNLRLHPSLFGRHLANVRMVSDRNKAKNACEFGSAEWYLAILGLTIESDPRSILSAFRSIAESDSSSRRLFDQIHGGEPRTNYEILAIQKHVVSGLDSVRDYRKSVRKSAKPAQKKRKATPGEHSFTTIWKVCVDKYVDPTILPLLTDRVKAAVCSLATRADNRTSVLVKDDSTRISTCVQAIVFVCKEGLNIPLTAVSQCVSAYFLRPVLNADEDSIEELRGLVRYKTTALYPLVSKATRESIRDKTRGVSAAFPDHMEVSMAYSYLNLPVALRQMYSDEEIDIAAQSIRSKLARPHTGQYRSPHIYNDLYIYWTENPVAALKLATRALKNAMTRVKGA